MEMTSPEAFDERKARQQFVRDRQKMVFTIAIAGLIVILVVALLAYFGVIGKSDATATEEKPNYGVTAPCVTGEDDKAKAPAASSITVRIMNATKHVGLAAAVGKAMENREFKVQQVTDYPGTTVFKRTEIRFGANGINQAYTVAGNFNDAIMRMDDRSDKLVDVVIGSTFSNLVEVEDVKTSVGETLESIEGCVAAKDIKDLPAAAKHTAVK